MHEVLIHAGEEFVVFRASQANTAIRIATHANEDGLDATIIWADQRRPVEHFPAFADLSLEG